MPRNYWLLKTEPSTYSFERLLQERQTNWNDVRNFQARNYLRTVSPGDLAIIYHSGDDKAVVGVAKIVNGPYPDPDPEKKGDWLQVDIEAVEKLSRPVPLSVIKATPTLADLPLIRHTRLSVMPITPVQFDTLLRLGGKS